jgi:hypothetical protein
MAVALATVGVIVLAGALILWLRHTTGETGAAPDPAAYARSAPVRSADAADESWLGGQFAGVQEKASWLTPVGSSVFDVCSVEGGGPDLLGGTGYGFYCSRTGTRYYAYGSEGAARIRQLKRALRGLGWAGFASEAEPGQASLPTVSAEPAAIALPAGKTELEYSWAQRGDQVKLARALGAVPPLAAPGRNTYLAVTRPSRAAILARLTPAHGHLLIISITADYATRLVA